MLKISKKSGWIPDKKDPRDVKHHEVFGSEFPEKLPAVFNWLSNCPPTPYQNGHQSCVICSEAFIQQFNSKLENINVNLSFRWNYAKTPGGTGGRTFRETAKFLQENGMPESSFCLNDISLSRADFLKVPDGLDLRLNAKLRAIKNYEFVEVDANNLKNAVKRQPIIIAVEVRGDWNADIIKWNEKATNVYHALVLLGWDDNLQSWICANWWKPTYDNFIKLDYGYPIVSAMSFEDLPDDWVSKVKSMYILKRSPDNWKEVYAINNGTKRHIANYQTLILGSKSPDTLWIWQEGDDIPQATAEEWNKLQLGSEIHLDPAE